MNTKAMKDVLDQVGEGVLTEDSKTMLTEAFEDAVNTKVNERLELELESKIQQIDEDHAVKLETLLNAIDTDHSKKLVTILERIDEDHTEKLKFLINRHNNNLQTDAALFKEKLVKQISNYISLFLEKSIPLEDLKEAVNNRKASRLVEQMKQVISLDESYISNTVADAVKEGKNVIDSLKNELSEAVKQNIDLSQKLNARTANLLLEKRTASLSRDKKNYVLRMLRDKDPDYIKENFDYVVKMFEKEEENEKDVLLERASKSSRTIREKLDTPSKKDLVNEDKDLSVLLDSVSLDAEKGTDTYLNVMKNQDRFLV